MRHDIAGTDWNEAVIGRLRSLWAEGHSTAEIGRRMGKSKNAIVGKAHRLHLPARPSPIRRSPTPTARERRQQLPRSAALTQAPARTVPKQMPQAKAEAPRPQTATEANRPVVGHRITRLWSGSTLQADRENSCSWPLGEPGRSSFRFCEDPTLRGKPYCSDHCRVAYPKMKAPQEHQPQEDGRV